jgi:hypothetical protein
MKIIKYLFIILIFELTLGGGGRLIEFRGISLRILLLALVIVLTVTYLLNKNLPKKFIRGPYIILFGWVFMNCIALIIGFSQEGFNFSQAFTDIKGQLLFLTIPFFCYIFFTLENVLAIIKKVFTYNGLVIASLQLILLGLLFFKIIPYQETYNYLYDTQEFSFRSFPFFFYKGLIYSTFSIPFLIIFKPRFYRFFLVIIFLSVLFSFTRGLILISVISLLLTWIYKINSNIKLILFLTGICIILYLGSIYFFDVYEIYFSSKGISDNQRLEDTFFIIQNISVNNFLTGNGLGSLINGRVNIENSFLWIFFKYGLIGLTFWVIFLMYLFKLMRFSMKVEKFNKISICFSITLYMLVIQSFTNPFINNTIGLTLIIIILCVFKRIHYAFSSKIIQL